MRLGVVGGSRMRRLVICALAWACSISAASAAPMEARVQLHQGKLATADLTRVLLDNVHLKGIELDVGSIDLTGLRGAAFVRAFNTALGDGCNVAVKDDAL